MIILTSDEPMRSSESASVVVKTGNGRTGDHHEFHLSGTFLRATLDSSDSILTIWATEPALPQGAYDASVGVESRYIIRLKILWTQAEGLGDALVAALRRHRRKKLPQS